MECGLIFVCDRYWCVPCVEQRITDLERRVKALEDYVQLSADVPTTEIYAMAAFRKAMLNSGR